MAADSGDRDFLMGLRKKILLTLGSALIVISATLAGIFYYYYTHPEAIKPLVENTIAQSTGATCTIQTLTYSLSPLRMRATGISVTPGSGLQGVQAKISDMAADMELTGPLGRRTLVVKHISVQGASLRVREDVRVHGIRPGMGGTSLLAGLLRRSIGVFLFRDIAIGGGRLAGGDIRVEIPEFRFRMEGIRAAITRDKAIEVSGSALLHYPARNLSLRIPELVLQTHGTFSLVDPEIKGTLAARNATLASPYGDVRQVHANAKIGYSHNARRLALEPFHLQWEGADTPFSFSTRALVHIRKRTIQARHMDLDFRDTLSFRGSADLALEPRISLHCDISESRLMPGKLLALVPREIRKDLPPLTLSGPVRLQGSFKAERKDGDWVPEPDLRVTLDQNPFAFRDARFQIGGSLTGVARITESPAGLGVSLQMTARDMDLSGQDFHSLFSTLDIRSRGIINLAEKTCRTSRLSLVLSDILKLEGGLQLRYGPLSRIALTCSQGSVSLEKIRPLLPGYLQKEISPLKMKGPVHFNGVIEGKGAGMERHWVSDLHSRFMQNSLYYEKDGVQVKTRASGELHFNGPVLNPDFRGQLTGEQTVLAGFGVKTDPFKARLSLSGKDEVFVLDAIDLTIPSLKAKIGEKEIPVSDIRVRCPEGQYNNREKSLHLSDLRVDTSLLKNLLLSLKKGRGGIDIQLQGEETGLLASARVLGLLPEGWRAEGKDQMQLSLSRTGKGPWKVQSALELHGLRFENRQSSCVAEQVSLSSRIKAEFDSKAQSLKGNLSLDSGKGEFLYDRFYFDLGRNPFSLSLEGAGDALKKSVDLSSGLIRFKDVMGLEVQGSIRTKPEPSVRASLKLRPSPLETVFKHFVLEPFEPEHPILGSIGVGGVLTADLELEGSPGSWTARGYSHWHQGRLSSERHGVFLKEIQLDLPLQVVKQRPGNARKAMEGRLRIGDAALPLIRNRVFEWPLRARANGLDIPGDTVLKTAGGDITVGPVLGKDLYSAKRSIQTSLTLDDIRVAPLLADIWPQAPDGNIKGSLDPVVMSANRVKGRGEILAEIFGGRILFHDFALANPFSPAPVYGVSAEWQDLSLEEITSRTGFGKVEGIVQGYVKGLEIAYGQPQKFELFLETIEKKGVDQKISQLAVNNIAQVAGGPHAAPGMAGGMAFLLRDVESPYKKMGIKASLRNDRFRINGTIHEEGKEYLIKRPWHSGVDVINWEPDNSIPFKDMMKRIRNVKISVEQ